jgi:hypothetical protein
MTATVIDLHRCSQRRSMKVTVANTAAAEAAFLAFYAKVDAAAKAERPNVSYGDYALDIWGRDGAPR